MTEADDEFVMMGEDFQRDAKDAKTRRRGWAGHSRNGEEEGKKKRRRSPYFTSKKKKKMATGW